MPVTDLKSAVTPDSSLRNSNLIIRAENKLRQMPESVGNLPIDSNEGRVCRLGSGGAQLSVPIDFGLRLLSKSSAWPWGLRIFALDVIVRL